MKTSIVSFIVFLLVVTTNAIREYNRIVGSQTWKYIIDDEESNFTAAIKWCRQQGGQMPTFHNQADIDFISDTVIVQGSRGPIGTWIGLKKTAGTCDKFLDGSPFDFQPRYASATS